MYFWTAMENKPKNWLQNKLMTYHNWNLSLEKIILLVYLFIFLKCSHMDIVGSSTIVLWTHLNGLSEKIAIYSFLVLRLHHRAGSNPLELHGTVYVVACTNCGFSFPRSSFQDQVKALNPKVGSFISMFFPYCFHSFICPRN